MEKKHISKGHRTAESMKKKKQNKNIVIIETIVVV